MIEKRTLARPYAKALFSLADDTKEFDQWSGVLAGLNSVMSDENAQRFIEDSTQSSLEVTQFLLDLCSGFSTDGVRNFITLLVAKKRLHLLEEISQLYEGMRREHEGKMKLSFFSTVSLTESQKERFQALLATHFKRMVNVEWAVDEHLFGGFLIKMGNETIDGSLRGQLTALKALVSD
jgi:F-type H+-transporting ATPase subunit delta